MRGATMKSAKELSLPSNFNPRAPCGARQGSAVVHRQAVGISIHAPHAGRDVAVVPRVKRALEFQSTRPMRGATVRDAEGSRRVVISIHAPHAGRDRREHRWHDRRGHISIHAPHAGRDLTPKGGNRRARNFNPRAPCGARLQPISAVRIISFDFNPRAPCGARL